MVTSNMSQNFLSWCGILVALGCIGGYGLNAYKLTQCDFESPYKCEVVHGVGLVPPLWVVAVWFDTDT